MNSFLRHPGPKSSFRNDTTKVNIISSSAPSSKGLSSSLSSSASSTKSSLLSELNHYASVTSSQTANYYQAYKHRSFSSSSYDNNQNNWFAQFNTKLKVVNDIYIIDSVELLNEFFQFYYHKRVNYSASNSRNLFPYLHGLENYEQRRFYLEDGSSNDLNEKIGKLNINNVIFVKTDEANEIPNLINSINIEELKVDGIYQGLNQLQHVTYTNLPVDCRNFKNQIKLFASLSHFMVYNYSNNSSSSFATILKTISPDKFIYSIEIPDWWCYLDGCYFEDGSDDLKIYNNGFLGSDYKPYNLNHPLKYLNYEQNLIWRLYTMKWICNNRVGVGNSHEYDAMSKKGFKLFIHCADNHSLPAMNQIQLIWHDYISGNNNLSEYHLDLPSSNFFQLDGFSNTEMMIVLNVLKFIERISRVNKVFVYCHDGYSATSILIIAVTQLLSKKSLEESIILLNQQGIKLFYNNFNLEFLSVLENFIDFLSNFLIQEFPTIIPITSLNLYAINQQYLNCPTNKPSYDWFTPKFSDNNFPSRISSNIYLGSVDHASSATVINSLEINDIISIGELPTWWILLNKLIIFDFEEELNIFPNVIKITPIYSFGKSHLYEVDMTEISIPFQYRKLIPKVKSFIYLHNFNDDGKDSLLNLLIDAPTFIQDKVLLGNSSSLNSKKSLIHCKIGVSRSATILIASLMKKFRLSLLQAYMAIRVLRFNFIIQPNLKLFYDLYMFQNYLGVLDQDRNMKKWNFEFICNEIHKLNLHHYG
ncbi:unnamed protein product [Candida verbasci]|uniref:Uncharacterized protein n=1 Tax=Candida verbasci TaxID=1227364 RepID=A0A9W4U0L9_9ASCO|nr:unnamed protein product [Candida verbasci]